MRLVYYSIAFNAETACTRQWIGSIRTLRRFNQRIPVHVVTYGSMPPELIQEAWQHGVHVHAIGDYTEYLHRLTAHGVALAQFPTFHKFLCLGEPWFDSAEQILFVDCDTWFFSDVEALFDTYRSCDWYAREEPYSRRSHYGYNADHIDENALERLGASLGTRSIAPFNSGVCLFGGQLRAALSRLRTTYLDIAWRLLVGRALTKTPIRPEESDVRALTLSRASALDRRRALPYPSQNHWIIEQIALWLTLAHAPGWTQGFFDPAHVAQNGELLERDLRCAPAIVGHYFSSLEQEFSSALSAATRS